MDNKKITDKIAREFLQIAKDLAWFTDNASLGPYGQVRWARRIPKTSYYRKLRRFEEAGLVKRIRKKYGSFVLTESAKRLRRLPTKKNDRSDGLSTIIMFDIPEEKHKARDNFRRYLIRNGYTQIQKSVFVSAFKIFDELKEFAKELKIESNISIIAGKFEQF